ncbi:hypothetical protein [Uliginosibacterium gangwonense]|uniref:hypothetical protein n=1 Tax=Uliginosibacterium gangwonense TaxID=392736 RepID=UPI000376C4F4|nr:hypothetical protein [Uliginosibacterium gangwonense]
MKSTKKLLVAVILVGLACTAYAKDKSGIAKIDNLYRAFVKDGNSTLNLPEYGQSIKLQAVALEVRDSMSGDAFLSVGAKANGKELARLVFDDEDALANIQPGQQILAECEMGFSSGTNYIPFESCQIK